MPDTWFTADFHLGHANIIRYCGRPFESVAEMDAAILGRLNSSVAEDDILYFLGDFCRGSGREALAYRKRIGAKTSSSSRGTTTMAHARSLPNFAGGSNSRK